MAIILIQLIVFIAWGQPGTAIGWFTLFEDNEIAGLLAFELLLIVSVAVGIATTLALYIALRRVNESFMMIALALGLLEATAFILARPTFEMLYLSEGYAAATTDAQRAMFLAAGEAALAAYRGTAFDVYYVLNDIILLVIAAVMLRSHIFSRATAYSGLIAGALMAVPSTAGTLGMYMALASLLPWMVFSVLVARGLFQISKAS